MKKPKLGTRMLTTGAIVFVAAIVVGFLIWRFIQHPWTRDGQVDANVIMIAPRVTGVVVEVAVADNQPVKQGDLLFRIDPSDFELDVATARVQVDQARQQVASLQAAVVAAEAGVAEANAGITTASTQIDAARAQVASAEASVSGAQAGLTSAQASIDRSQAGLEESKKESDRAERLAKDRAGSVATAESKAAAVQKAQASLDGSQAGLLGAQSSVEQATAALRQAQAGLASAEAGKVQAEAQLASAQAGLAEARANLGAPGDENVQVRAAKVSLASAELDLNWTAVRAPTDGYVTNLSVDLGDYATSGTPLLAFVDSASFRVQGFFRETQLRHIQPGDRAVVTLMSHRNKPIEGVVDSIGWAINPPNIATTEGTSGLVPQVQPSFDWIRLAQRVPVRIRLGEIPEGVQLVSGTTASVAIKPEN